jgi:hypothetical protein
MTPRLGAAVVAGSVGVAADFTEADFMEAGIAAVACMPAALHARPIR